MSQQEEILPFVLGGQILDRRYPNILHPSTSSQRKINRTISPAEWEEFCNEFEAAMSWSKNWPACFLNRSVILAFSLWFASVVLLVVTRHQEEELNLDNIHNTTTTTITTSHGYFHTHPATSFLTRELLPDICVLFLLLLAIAMAISMIQMSMQLNHSVEAVCEDYTLRYQDYYGISFAIQKRSQPSIASPPWRSSHSRKHSRHTHEFRSFLVITRQEEEEATSRYQNATTGRNYNPHPQHPNDELGKPPFFDVYGSAMTIKLPGTIEIYLWVVWVLQLNSAQHNISSHSEAARKISYRSRRNEKA